MGSDPQIDLNIEGYQEPISIPTEANKGGVLLYVRTGINFKPRKDLSWVQLSIMWYELL